MARTELIAGRKNQMGITSDSWYKCKIQNLHDSSTCVTDGNFKQDLLDFS